MEKAEAIKLFGTPDKTAAAVGVSKQAVSQWPPILTKKIADRIIAAAYRSKKRLPAELLG